MKTAINYREFYIELGKLVYAISKADGKVRKKEFETLHTLITEDLIFLDNIRDSFGTDLSWYTEFEFEAMENDEVSSEEAFTSFLYYLHENKNLLDQKHRDVILSISKKIANSFRGICKAEEDIINRLDAELA
jgi:uncharacterized tellurite resistance protein B-like protein